jgi:uncharacterized protein (TIGR02246 family)
MPLELEDTTAILQLYARYNTAIDTGDGETFGQCFAENGVFEPGHATITGHENLVEFAHQTHNAMPLMRHNATNILVDGDGSNATSSSFLIGYLAGKEYKVIVTGRYADKLAKIDGRWRFTERVFSMDQ